MIIHCFLNYEYITKMLHNEGIYMSEKDILKLTGLMNDFIRYEERMENTAKVLHEIFNNVKDGIIIHNEKGNIIDANKSALNIFNLSKMELTNMNMLYDLSHKESPFESIPKLWKEAIEGKSPSFLWIGREPKTSKKLYLEIALSRIQLKDKLYILASIRDKSDVKHFESILHETEKIFKSAIDNLDEAVIVTEPNINNDGPRVIYINPKFSKIFGYTRYEIIGKTPAVFSYEGMDKHLRKDIKKSLSNTAKWEGYITNKSKEGKLVKAHLSIYPIVDKDALINFVGIYRDIIYV